MKKIGTALGCALLLVGMTGCAAPRDSVPENSSGEQSKAVNTDPRKGWVVVREQTYGIGGDDGNVQRLIVKTCDETTLLYVSIGTTYATGSGSGNGITAIPNSPECQPELR